MKEKGTCNLALSGISSAAGDNVSSVFSHDGVSYSQNSQCGAATENFTLPEISQGTCSPGTEESLKKDECENFIKAQNPLILNTVTDLVTKSCSSEVRKELNILCLVSNIQHFRHSTFFLRLN